MSTSYNPYIEILHICFPRVKVSRDTETSFLHFFGKQQCIACFFVILQNSKAKYTSPSNIMFFFFMFQWFLYFSGNCSSEFNA